MGESPGKAWLQALGKQELEVSSATSALTPKGYLDSGNYALNWAISGRFLGGYPLGHSVEIFGDQSTGKSFLATRAIGMAQARGGVSVLDDTEGAYDLRWIGALGVDPDSLAIRYSTTVKDLLEGVLGFLGAFGAVQKEFPVGLYCCDSLAALSTEHELSVRLDKRDMSKAAELKSFFRQIGRKLNDLPAILITTNHTIADIGGFGQSRTTPGGGGPKFHSSVRLDLRATKKIKGSGDYAGVISRVVVNKTRFTSPWKEVRLAIPFYQPVSRASGLIPVLLEQGILGTTPGHNLSLNKEDLGIAAHKTSFLKQDKSAEQLLETFPELLQDADEILLKRAPGFEEEED